jgi:hypothetical protein
LYSRDSIGFLEARAPKKLKKDLRVRVRALTVTHIEFHVRARLGDLTERCGDQDEEKFSN